MTLGEQIKQAREKKNLSQEDLAERIGVSRQAVSKWENDTSVPQGINREVLAEVLELEPWVPFFLSSYRRKSHFGASNKSPLVKNT